ncbi:hypothetical protein BS47DRAFT_775442 [Hydnum rufescens UP504]|uniref:Uncharacterized protein n=1 Tax=Hydnum rufescens UP504 TaxID=1448309 RepID=A0A9P6B0Y3_9AGAM|nr:hypothetical protein BS47DRAFT_775442 [Hydnum rufescens UP504]
MRCIADSSWTLFSFSFYPPCAITLLLDSLVHSPRCPTLHAFANFIRLCIVNTAAAPIRYKLSRCCRVVGAVSSIAFSLSAPPLHFLSPPSK